MNNLNDIFEDVNLDGIVDAEEIVNIDIDGIDDNSANLLGVILFVLHNSIILSLIASFNNILPPHFI